MIPLYIQCNHKEFKTLAVIQIVRNKTRKTGFAKPPLDDDGWILCI